MLPAVKKHPTQSKWSIRLRNSSGHPLFYSLAEASWIGHKNIFICFYNIILKTEPWQVYPLPWGFWYKNFEKWKIRKQDFSLFVEWDCTLSKMSLPVPLLRFRTVHVRHDRNLLSSASSGLQGPLQSSPEQSSQWKEFNLNWREKVFLFLAPAFPEHGYGVCLFANLRHWC